MRVRVKSIFGIRLRRFGAAVGAVAAIAVSPISSAAESTVEFDLPAQNLALSLKQVADEFGLKIAFYTEFTDGLEAPALSGRYTASEAFDALLRDTSLEYTYVVETTVAVRPRSSNPTHGEPAMTDRDQTRQRRRPGIDRVVTALAAILVAGPTVAAEQDDGEGDAARDEVETLVVTGTRLSRQISGAPIHVITREEMAERGIASIEDVVRSLPQNYSDVNAAATLDNSLNSVDAIGQSAVDLRALGRGTLVLVNGRRWVQSSTFGDGTVNLNGIPFNAVKRVEVLADGASAIYGADAQAGVINFILRDDFVGGETSLRQDLGANGGDVLKFDQTLGFTWDTGQAMAVVGYQENEPVNRQKAGLTTLDFRPRGGSDQRSTFFTQPGKVGYGFPGGFFQVITLGALPAEDDGTGGVAGRLSPANVTPYDSALNGATAVSDSLTAYLQFNQGLRDGAVKLYGELNYADSSSHTTGTPLAGVYTVPPTNPYNDVPPSPPFVVSVGYVFEAETLAGLMPPRSNEGGQTNTTATIGAAAELPWFDWGLDFSTTFGSEDAYFGFVAPNTELLNQRLAGVDGSGNPLPMDQIINPFGNGAAQSPAAVEGLIELFTGDGPAAANTNTASQRGHLLTLNGGLFDLPGGRSQVALGAEIRTETLDYSSDQSRGTLFIVLQPEREAVSLFGEWSFPLVAEHNGIAGIHSLGLKLAIRADDYSFAGPFDGPSAPSREKSFNHTSPKVDLAWHPLESLKIRASWGESFVPPLTRNLFSSTNGPFNFVRVVDPEQPAAGLQFPDAYFTGNPDLTPEVADNLSAGFDWAPGGFLEGLSVALTYVDIDISDRVGSGTTIAFDQPELLFEIPGMVERAPDGSIARLNLRPVNIAARQSRSVDATISYGFDTALGAFRVGLNGTYTDFLRDTTLPGADPTHLHGTPRGPERIKGRGFANLSRGDLTLNVNANYSSSYHNPSFSAPHAVDSYLTFDLTGSYTFGGSGWQINAGGRNLFDAEFPFFNGFGTPWDPRRVDTRGRIVYLQVKKSYDLPF